MSSRPSFSGRQLVDALTELMEKPQFNPVIVTIRPDLAVANLNKTAPPYWWVTEVRWSDRWSAFELVIR